MLGTNWHNIFVTWRESLKHNILRYSSLKKCTHMRFQF
jgi:hypothetical protein